MRRRDAVVDRHRAARSRANSRCRDGRRAIPAFQLLAERFLTDEYAADNVASAAASTRTRSAASPRKSPTSPSTSRSRVEQPWTDTHGRTHAEMIGRPVVDARDARHQRAQQRIPHLPHAARACRCCSARSIRRAVSAISRRIRNRCRRRIRPARRARKTARSNADPLGYVSSPDDLVVDANGAPRRIDKAFSWEYPLAAHGMHARGDPQRVRRRSVSHRHAVHVHGEHGLEFVDEHRRDAAHARAEKRVGRRTRFRTSSIPTRSIPKRSRSPIWCCRTRRISNATIASACSTVRFPMRTARRIRSVSRSLPLDRDVRPFQDVLLDLGARLKLPGMLDENGSPKYPRGFAQLHGRARTRAGRRIARRLARRERQ